MSSHDLTAERRHVFQRQDGPSGALADDGLAMRLMPPATRLSLRMKAGSENRAGQAAGFDLAQPINSLRATQAESSASRLSARLGPDEWLLIADGDRDAADTLADTLTRDLGEHAHTLVDVSHRNMAIELIGHAAADVLNSGCPLDLGDNAFPVGTATRSLFAKSEIVLLRTAGPDQRPLFRVECWRSFGRYVHAHLRDAATLIGADR